MPRINPLSVEVKQGRPRDGRTKLSRLMKATRKAMVDQLGGEEALTGGQVLLIERAVTLQACLTALDRKRADGVLTEREHAEYVDLNAAFIRTVSRLGLHNPPPEEPPPDPLQRLADHLAGIRARAPEAA